MARERNEEIVISDLRCRIRPISNSPVAIFALLLFLTPSQASPPKRPSILLPGNSPLVTFRILFMTGSAFDPPGNEGLAAITASMLARGGSRSMTYDQILQTLYPMASSVNAQVDK